jgi:nitric oxide reductase subunit C
MSETFLRRAFFIATFISMAVLGAMTIDTIRQVVVSRTPPLDDSVVAGKRIWQERNCNDCHTVLGIGGYYAPELTRVVERRDDAWLRKFLLQPAAAKPGTTMPDQRLSAAHVDALIAFHHWVNGINTNGWPPAPLTRGANSEAAMLFEQKGCSGCHRLDGRGPSEHAPDLSALVNRPDSRARVIAYLEDPAKQNPETLMPQPDLTRAEQAALVAYLTQPR